MTRARLLARVWKDHRGFTLIEMIVVVIILGLLAGLVGPRLFGRVGQSKMVAARAQIELLGAALDQYSLDVGTYPPSSVGLEALVRNPNIAAWNGPYLKKNAIPPDPWGNPYQYKCCPGDHGEYDLWSDGADGKPGGEGRAPTSLRGRSSEPSSRASCERDEARALWQPEAYVRLGEPQPRRADMERERATTLRAARARAPWQFELSSAAARRGLSGSGEAD